MLSSWTLMPLVFCVTLVASLGLTALVRRLALQRGLVDIPGDDRRVHRIPVPRLGGLAMFAAFAIGVGLTSLSGVFTSGKTYNGQFEFGRVLIMLLGAAIITLVMAVDDIRGLRALPRLLWQIGVALLVVLPSLFWPGGPNLTPGGQLEPPGTTHYDQGLGVIATSIQSPFSGPIDLPLAVAVFFTIFWIVGMTNTINWIDGLDGLAAGISLVACAVLFIITNFVLGQITISYLPLILGASILGFLPFNVHPARIFMGDSGAMFLGFTLAVLSITGGAKLAAALLVLGIPMLDAVYMIAYRLYRRQSPMSADRRHLHHRLLDLGLSQQRVVMIFYLLCGTFGLIGLLPGGEVHILGVLVPSGMFRLFKLAALVVMVVLLVGMMVYLARRQFDPVGPSSGRGRVG